MGGVNGFEPEHIGRPANICAEAYNAIRVRGAQRLPMADVAEGFPPWRGGT